MNTRKLKGKSVKMENSVWDDLLSTRRFLRKIRKSRDSSFGLYCAGLAIITVQGMVPFLLDPWSWAGRALKPKLSSSIMISPSCPERIRKKPIPVNYSLIGNVLAKDSLCPRLPGIALGRYRCRTFPNILIRNNGIGPHPHEWNQEIIITPPLILSYK